MLHKHMYVYFHYTFVQEPILRAMQYLPGILKLQKFMFDHFHQQMGQDRALGETIGICKSLLKEGNIHILCILPFLLCFMFLQVVNYTIHTTRKPHTKV